MEYTLFMFALNFWSSNVITFIFKVLRMSKYVPVLYRYCVKQVNSSWKLSWQVYERAT